MEIQTIDLTYCASEHSVIALGNFDGVHLGHLALLHKAIARAKELNVKSSVLLFREHSDNMIKAQEKTIITNNQIKLQILEQLGIDIVYIIDFTREVMSLDPIIFLNCFLKHHLKIIGVVVGYDYSFGKHATGTVSLLKKHQHLFQTIDVIDAVIEEGSVVSSTRIRKNIQQGKVKEASTLLTRPFRITGKIVHGKKLGSAMGYPTANIQMDANYVIPRFGVYDTNIGINGKCYKAATNVGVNPTVDCDSIKIEAHILDFHENIYSKEVYLDFLDFLRPEVTFQTVEELFLQIEQDTEKVRRRKDLQL